MGNFLQDFWNALKDPWKDGYQFGDISSGIINGALGSLTGGKLWNDLTGKSNTDAQNSAAAALQEDAQAFNSAESAAQREWESAEAQKNRDWQTEMANTAHQREVADLQAAGLNPWLSAGGGASTGSAVSAVGSSASSGIASAQASNVSLLSSIGTAAAGIGILIKAAKMAAK